MGTAKVYINGEYVDRDLASVSVYDHGFLYGDGVFEGIRIYAGSAFRLEDHVMRLYESADAIGLTIPLPADGMERAVRESIRLNGKVEGYVRLVVTRGNGDLGLNPDNCRAANVIIIVDDIALYPAECYDRGIAVVTAATRRTGADMLDPRIKSLNYLNNIMARMEARRAGCMEAILLNREGYVAECTGDNIFIVKNGALATPHPSVGLLRGITRDTVIGLAGRAGMGCDETWLTPFDLYTADECFLTGTGAEIMPVTSIDGRTVGTGKPGPVTVSLTLSYRELVSRPAA